MTSIGSPGMSDQETKWAAMEQPASPATPTAVASPGARGSDRRAVSIETQSEAAVATICGREPGRSTLGRNGRCSLRACLLVNHPLTLQRVLVGALSPTLSPNTGPRNRRSRHDG